MPGNESPGSPTEFLAAEIGHCTGRLASIARRCPAPWELDADNLGAARKCVADARRALESLRTSHAELAAFTEMGLDERDVCEAVPALIDAYQRMILTLTAAIQRKNLQAA